MNSYPVETGPSTLTPTPSRMTSNYSVDTGTLTPTPSRMNNYLDTPSPNHPYPQPPSPHPSHQRSLSTGVGAGSQYGGVGFGNGGVVVEGQQGGLSTPQTHTLQERKVFVGGLSWETTDEKLRIYFQNFGAVEDSVVIRDKQSGRPRGFGFVVFENPAHAVKVVSIHKHTVDRREVETRLAVPKDSAELQQRANSGGMGSASAQQRKLFVGGLAPTVSERIFRQYFQQYGAIEDIVVMYDHTSGRPRGFGFVTYRGEESLQRVFSQQVHVIHEKQIDVKPAISREQMPQQVVYGNGRRRLPSAAVGGFNDYGGGTMSGIQDMVNMYGLGNELEYMNSGLGAGGMPQLPGSFGLNGLENGNIYGGFGGGFANHFGGGQYDYPIPAVEEQQLLGQNVGDGQIINGQMNQLNGLDSLGLRMQNAEGDVVDFQQFQDAQHVRNESKASVELGVLDTFASALSTQLDQIPLQTTQGSSLATLSHQVNSLLGEENVR